MRCFVLKGRMKVLEMAAISMIFFGGCKSVNSSSGESMSWLDSSCTEQKTSQEDFSFAEQTTSDGQAQDVVVKTPENTVTVPKGYTVWNNVFVKVAQEDGVLSVTLLENGQEMPLEYKEIHTSYKCPDGEENVHYNIHFVLWEWQGKTGFEKINDNDLSGSMHWDMDYNSESRNTVLICLYGYQSHMQFVTYDLRTGMFCDQLEGMDFTGKDMISEVVYSDHNKTQAILSCNDGKMLYDVDLSAKTAVNLIEAAQISDSGCIQWEACWADENTLLITGFTDEFQSISCWTYDKSTGKTVRTISDLPNADANEGSGAVMYPGRYGLMLQKDNTAAVIDKMTGEQKAIPDFIYKQEDTYDNSMECLYEITDQGDSLVMRELSMKKGVFIGAWQIKKPGIESRLISWEMMDNRRVLATFSPEGNDSNVQYLYELK